jgi:flagellar hook assembly protein FlgD
MYLIHQSKRPFRIGLSLFALAACAVLHFVAAPQANAAVTNVTLEPGSNPILYETVGVPTGTTIYVTLGAGTYDVTINIYRLANITDTPSASNLVAAIEQSGVAGGGTRAFSWDALWLLGNDLGRKAGNYRVIVGANDGTTDSTFSLGSLLVINSVDIHSMSVIPTPDSNGGLSFPYAITYALAKPALVTVRVKNAANTTVRTLIANVAQPGEDTATNLLYWDGKDDNGRPVPIGVYTVTVDARDASTADAAITRSRTVAVGSLAGLGESLKTIFEDNAFVYPNPVRNGQATIQAVPVREGARLSLRIYTIAGDLVKDVQLGTGTVGNPITYAWDATNQAGKKVGRGLYFLVVKEEDPQGTFQAVKKMAVIP